MKTFLDRFLEVINPGDHILDLGSGKGIQALMLAQKKASVLAIDKTFPADATTHPLIQRKEQDIEQWFLDTSEKPQFDAILLRNIIQFFPKDWMLIKLFPALKEMTKAGGVIAIETFFDVPNPPFPKNHSSYWEPYDFQNIFPGWTEMYMHKNEEARQDLTGTKRLFRILDAIYKKP